MRYRLALAAVWFLSCLGCSLNEEIHISSLMQAHRSHEVIQQVEAELASGKRVSSFHLYCLCEAYADVRRYDKMLSSADLLQKSIDAGDDTYFAGSLRAFPQILRARAQLDLGDYPKAIQAASDAYVVLQKAGLLQSFYRYQLISILGTRGLAYALSGQKAQAQADLEALAAVNIFESDLGPDKHIAIARIHMANRDFRGALAEMGLESQPPAVLTLFYDATFQTLPRDFIITKSLYETGQIGPARQGYDRLLSYPYIAQVGSIYWVALLDRARIARADHNPDLAAQLLSKAIEVIEQQRSSIHTEAGRIGFVGDKQEVYQEMVSLLMDQRRTGEAFEYVERAKARALVDLLASQQDLPVADGNAPQAAETLKTLEKLRNAEVELAAVPASTDAGAASQRGVVVGLKADLVAEAPELASLVTVTGTSLGSIQQLLADDEALVEYYPSPAGMYAFVLSCDSIAVSALPDAGGKLAEDIQQFRAAVMNPASQNYLALGQGLYQRLFAPLAGNIRQTRLIIVPYGPLHYVPFCALYDGREYLLDRYSIRILPSASVLKFLQRRRGVGKDNLLALGNPDLGKPELDLQYAEEEVRAIAKTAPSATVRVRSEATKSFVKANGGRYKMLHFATHGLFDPANPLGSSLLLAEDKDSDGRLTVAELYYLHLDADLVTLSACETALGKVAGGDDVVGFTRGLLYAGASSIVSSLWKVDDRSTRDLMIAFYSNLGSMDKAEALRQAQRTVRQAHPHPYFWAAFMLTGHP
ncbi:MAG: CHAT domain-containing protein [Phycisphaerae bacterium]